MPLNSLSSTLNPGQLKDLVENFLTVSWHKNKNQRPQILKALDISNDSDSERGSSIAKENVLNNIVGDAVTQGLAHFGGGNVVESLIYILELEHGVNFKNIANQIQEFRTGIEKMFGTASYVVEEQVCSNLAKTLGLDPSGRSLEELIEEARIRISEENKTAATTFTH